MRRISSAFWLGVMVMSGGCMVGPKYQSPEVDSIQGYVSQEDIALSTIPSLTMGARIQEDWWNLFHSPPLHKMMQEALAGNKNLAAAQASLKKVHAETTVAASAAFPHIGLDMMAGRQKHGMSVSGLTSVDAPTYTYYSIGPMFSYTLDMFGGVRHGIDRQRALAGYQSHLVQATYLTLTGDITVQALHLAALRTQIDTIETIIENDARNLFLTDIAFYIGTTTQVDILRAQKQLAEDKALLAPLQQQASIARHALALLAGKTPAEWSPPDFTLDTFTLPEKMPVTLPSEMVHHRPDILAAEAQLKAANAAIGIATANLYPKINLSASLTQQALTPGGLFASTADAWGLLADVTQPIFEGKALEAERAATIAAYEAALAMYQQTVLTAFQQVADALQALAHNAETIKTQQQLCAVAEKAVHIAVVRYNVGDGDLFELLEAERAYAKTMMVMSQVTAQKYINAATLWLALGGGSGMSTFGNISDE